MNWWIPVLSFAGALIGGGIPAWSAWRARRQNARSEWRARLDKAIELLTSDTEEEQQIGDELLTDLIDSDLGNDSDRALARRVAEIRVRGQAPGPRTVVEGLDRRVDNGIEEGNP